MDFEEHALVYTTILTQTCAAVNLIHHFWTRTRVANQNVEMLHTVGLLNIGIKFDILPIMLIRTEIILIVNTCTHYCEKYIF